MIEYHYTESGLDNIYLVNGFTLTKEGDDEILHIHDIHGLHKAIGSILISKSGLLSNKEIKFIRHTIDLSQKTLAAILGVDYQTVLGWEKGKRSISKTADHYLKTYLFAYLNRESNSIIYDKINEIADLDSGIVKKKVEQKLKLQSQDDEWKMVA